MEKLFRAALTVMEELEYNTNSETVDMQANGQPGQTGRQPQNG